MDFPRSMRAAILTQLNHPLVIDEVLLPEHLEVGQVLVKILCSGICGSQLGEIAGVKGTDPYLPHLLGHEAAGIVHQTGPGVTHVREGDHVVLHWRKGLGIDAKPPQYKWRNQKLNAGAIATFNEYAVVSENRLTAASKKYDPETLALFGCAITTGFGVIVNNARLSIGESVVIFGSGGVGLNMVQAASMVSAYPIIALDKFPKRLDLAKDLGATHCIDTTIDHAETQLRKLLPQGCDCFIDNTGHPSIIQLGYKLSKPQGRVVLVGVPLWNQEVNLHSLPLHFGKQLIGSHGGDTQPHLDIPKYLALIDANRADFSKLVTQRFTLDHINEAIQGMKEGTCVGRCMLHMQ